MSTQKVKKAQTKSSSQSAQAVQLSDLGLDVSQKKQATVAFSLWIRSLLQNWRQGTVACKGRADVNRTNKKPWKQKGTGRARAGSARSPLWRGGGVTFGPQPRTRTLTLSAQSKKNVLNALLFDYVDQSKISSLDWALNHERPKTAHAFSALKEAGLHNEKLILFLPTDDLLTYASFVNIPNVRILFFDQPNAFDLANSHHWVVLKKDLGHFKEMALKWI